MASTIEKYASLLGVIAILIVVLFNHKTTIESHEQVTKMLDSINHTILLQNKQLVKINDSIFSHIERRDKFEEKLSQDIKHQIDGVKYIRGSFDNVSDDQILLLLNKTYEKRTGHTIPAN